MSPLSSVQGPPWLGVADPKVTLTGKDNAWRHVLEVDLAPGERRAHAVDVRHVTRRLRLLDAVSGAPLRGRVPVALIVDAEQTDRHLVPDGQGEAELTLLAGTLHVDPPDHLVRTLRWDDVLPDVVELHFERDER